MGRKERKRYELNDQVRDLLKNDALSSEEIEFVKSSYSGIGGLTRSGWDNGQFFTPQNVCSFVVKMMGIENGRVLEPLCGGGAFLHHIPNSCEIVGQEIMVEAARVSELCYPSATIIQGDALSIHHDKLFDYVVGNPPFGLTVDWDFECGKKYKSEIGFIEYGLKNLKPGGILGMVMPDSILSNSREKDFRKHIVDNNTLLAVISFPTETFYFTGTSAKTSLLMIQKGRDIPDEDYKIFMAISEHIGHDKRGNSCDSDLDMILDAYISSEASHFNRKKQKAVILPFPEMEIVADKYGQFALAL